VTTTAPTTGDSRIHLLSVEGNYAASSRLQVYGRYALKSSHEDLLSRGITANTSLAWAGSPTTWTIAGTFAASSACWNRARPACGTGAWRWKPDIR
jgi:hypothetical protein